MKILSLDIETFPLLIHAWGLFDQVTGINQIIKNGYTLCFAAKWVGEKGVTFKSIFHDGQEEMLKTGHAMIEEADAVVGWNSQRFDVPTLNREFVCNNLPPPSPIKHIDLMKVVKKQFKLPSYKLAYVAELLGVGSKVKHEGHELWIKCGENDPKAWAKMKRYNIQDAALVEKLYYRIQPWIMNHPNRALYEYQGQASCPKCGSRDLESRGYAFTASGRFNKLHCNGCGAWSRRRTSDMDKNERNNLIIPA